MDLDQIEEVGLDPLKTMLREMGGWPVLEGDRSALIGQLAAILASDWSRG